MARVLGLATLAPDANAEQTISIGFQATWITITAVGDEDGEAHWSEGKAYNGLQRCLSTLAGDSHGPGNGWTESSYILRLRDHDGSGGFTVRASAKLKIINSTTFTLKEIVVPPAPALCRFLVEAGN